MIDFTPPPVKRYVRSKSERMLARKRRRRLRSLRICINGRDPAFSARGHRRAYVEHGAPNPSSGKCDRCELVSKATR